MSYTELEHGYQGLRKARPAFYVGDEGANIVRSVKNRGDLSELNGDEVYSEEGKQVVVGVCAMAKKSQSKPMKEILTRLEEFEYIKMIVFPEDVILQKPVEEWPMCDCLISFHSKGFPLDKAIQYAKLRKPFIINNLPMQYDIQDRRKVYSILESEGIEIPRYAVLDRDSPDPKDHELVESEDHVEVNGVVFNKPFVEKPVSAEDHNIYIYYPTPAGGGSQRLFRKIGSRSSVYSPESRVRKTGSFIYEDFMPTDGTDVKVYTVGPDYAHAEARKSPALDGKVERDSEGKEIRYPVILSNAEKLISRKVCLAFKQTVCGFDLLRANGKSFVCDVNGFSFVKNSNKYYDDCAKILGNMILRELAPTLHIPWSVPFQLDDPPIVPTTFGKMMELRCVVAIIRHGDRTPKQKMKVEVRHPKFFDIFEKYGGHVNGHVKLKRPKQLQEILDIARSLLNEIEHRAADPEIEEKQGKLEQLKSVLEMYGHFSGINRKVQMKYQPKGRPRGSSSDDDAPKEPSLVLILKWGGELTPAGRIQAEELGRIFRCMYPGGQGRHAGGEYAGTQGLGLLRLHSTFRHDLKIYASDEGRVQMTAAAFAKGLLALEGELTPILVQMVKSANTNGLLDNDCDASKHQNLAKTRLHELMQQDQDFTQEDREIINPCHSISISMALDFVKNPVKCCERVQDLIQKLMYIVRTKKDDPKTKDAILYHGETWELMMRRWGKIEKDFCTKNKTFDISKIPDIYDCIKYDLQHNQHTLQFDQAEELYINAKNLADIVIPQEYGLTKTEKLTISQGICTPLLKKIRADLQRNIEECGDETVNRLNPRYSHGVSSPGRHVRTRLYFTSESHIHSLLTVLRHGGLVDSAKDEQWRRAMEYVSMVSELNYMSQVVIMLYEDPTKDPSSEERFHVELHFSPGVNCCVQKNLPPGPGFRPHSRNDQSKHLSRIDQEDTTTEENSSSHTSTVSDSSGTSDCSPPSERKLTESVSSEFKIKSSEPIPIRASNSNCSNDLGTRLVNEEKHSLSVGSKQIRPPPSPEHEQRSRSFDQSRNANTNECCTDNQTDDQHFHEHSQSSVKTSENHVVSGSINIEFSNIKKAHLGNAWHSIRSNSFDLGDHINRRIKISESSSVRYSPVKSKNVVADFYNEPSNKIELRALDLAHVEVYPHQNSERRDNPPSFSRRNYTKVSPLETSKTESSYDSNEYMVKPNTHESKSAFVVLPQSSNSLKFSDNTNSVSLGNNAPPTANDSHTSKKDILLHERNKFENLFSDSILVTNTESITFNKRSMTDYITTIEEHSDRESPLSRSPTVEANKPELNKENLLSLSDADNLSGSIDSNVSKPKPDHSPISVFMSEDNVTTAKSPKIIFVKNKYATQRSAPSGFSTDPIINSHSVVSPHSSEFPNCFYQIVDDPDTLYFPVSPIAESRTKYPVENIHDDTFESPTPAEIRYEMQMQHLVRPSARRTHSVSHCLDMTCLSPPSLDPSQSRRHRHGISGQMSYFRMSGYGLIVQHQKRGGSTSSLFSTAVISGSSSAPNLRDMIPNTASVAAAIEGCGGVPPIRPLETLHNALSLKQLDQFLNRMTHGLGNRTPASSPPKNSAALSQTVQSPNNSTGWSGPPSFVSSSGPSSPNGLSDIFHGTSATSDSSDMSASIISNDGLSILGSRTVANNIYGHRDSFEISEFYSTPHLLHSLVHFSPIQASASGDSGELTPVSLGSEIDEPYHELGAMSDNMEPEILVCEDEEKTLTASTREDMIRPRLAEIKWTRDDEDDLTQKYGHNRIECADGSQNQPSHSKRCTNVLSADSYLKKYFVSCLHEIPLKEQTISNSEGNDENVKNFSGNVYNYGTKNIVKKSKYIDENDTNNVYSHLSTEMHTASCEGVFEMDSEISEIVQLETSSVLSMDSKLPSEVNNYRNLSGSVSPTLTLATSLTDKNSVSRGFVVPQESSDP